MTRYLGILLIFSACAEPDDEPCADAGVELIACRHLGCSVPSECAPDGLACVCQGGVRMRGRLPVRRRARLRCPRPVLVRRRHLLRVSEARHLGDLRRP
jgi:hypothetical protein